MFRIQKILLADYPNIYEHVLVESPLFAEVTEDGIGLRQVQLGLTPTKLIVGRDFFDRTPSGDFINSSLVEKDPEIECFDLVTILPLEALQISFYKRRNRVIMSVNVLERKTFLYEFGGYLSRNLFWNTWRERISAVRCLGPNLFNISGSSPFSSTDVIPDEEEVQASIHPSPRTHLSSALNTTPYPIPNVGLLYKKLSSKYTDVIEVASSHSLSIDTHHEMELQAYLSSLPLTNSTSYSCNTSW